MWLPLLGGVQVSESHFKSLPAYGETEQSHGGAGAAYRSPSHAKSCSCRLSLYLNTSPPCARSRFMVYNLCCCWPAPGHTAPAKGLQRTLLLKLAVQQSQSSFTERQGHGESPERLCKEYPGLTVGQMASKTRGARRIEGQPHKQPSSYLPNRPRPDSHLPPLARVERGSRSAAEAAVARGDEGEMEGPVVSGLPLLSLIAF
ncbi:unnamed protein product [Pleuronectes platessa]|uniref:Uncharacterized protein n=1 Tax=Pleuronectes platessa TaxID=8262 RepID=A0A9N7UIZ1_PLEPL|nr:unnamed protein product [Pleuronectes platessa]